VQPITVTRKAGIDGCTAQAVHHGYFECPAFEIARYSVTANGRLHDKLYDIFTALTYPTSQADSNLYGMMHDENLIEWNQSPSE
jgi:hypothetical protein